MTMHTHENLKHYNYEEKRYIALRYGNNKGKRIFQANNLKFIRHNSEYKLCQMIQTHKKQIFIDILTNEETNDEITDIKNFEEIIPYKELAKYSYVITDSYIKEILNNLNEDIILTR